jgi:hypothetical protein
MLWCKSFWTLFLFILSSVMDSQRFYKWINLFYDEWQHMFPGFDTTETLLSIKCVSAYGSSGSDRNKSCQICGYLSWLIFHFDSNTMQGVKRMKSSWKFRKGHDLNKGAWNVGHGVIRHPSISPTLEAIVYFVWSNFIWFLFPYIQTYLHTSFGDNRQMIAVMSVI